MSAAVGVISDVMRTAGRSEVFRAQRERIDGGIRALRDSAPALAEGIRTALAEVADGWKEIDGNRVRMNEVKRLLENYREFRMYVQDLDDWRCDCYEGIDIYPAAHEIAMNLVLLCRSCDRNVEGIVEALEKGAWPLSIRIFIVLWFYAQLTDSFCCEVQTIIFIFASERLPVKG